VKYTQYTHMRRILCACARVYKYSLHLCNAEIVVGRGDIATSVCVSVREISFYYIIILTYAPPRYHSETNWNSSSSSRVYIYIIIIKYITNIYAIVQPVGDTSSGDDLKKSINIIHFKRNIGTYVFICNFSDRRPSEAAASTVR